MRRHKITPQEGSAVRYQGAIGQREDGKVMEKDHR